MGHRRAMVREEDGMTATPDTYTRLRTVYDEGRILRGDWARTGADGRQMLSLLAAASPEVERTHRADACPASVMPAWVAHLTPDLGDSVSLDAWPGVTRRYVETARGWHLIDAAAWRRVQMATLIEGMLVALPHAGAAVGAVGAVLDRLRREAAGDVPSEEERGVAAAAAAAAGAASGAAAAAWAADAAAWAWAAAEAADAAAWAAEAARAAAWDRIADAFLTALEAEVAAVLA